MQLYSGNNTILVNKTSDCDFDLRINPSFVGSGTEGGIFAVTHDNTSTIALAGDGALVPLRADVRINQASDNVLQVTPTGLYVAASTNYTDTQARAAISSDFPITYNSSTGKIGIAIGNGSQAGAISAADWNIFNSKIGGGANVGSGVDVFKQKNGQNLEFRRLVQGNNISITQSGDSITVSSSLTPYSDPEARAAISGQAPISYNSATGVISLAASSTNTDGYLTSSDWNLFNSKVPQTRLVSTSGPLTGGGNLSSNLSLGITKGSLTTDGYISKEDFTTFNSKQDSITWNTVSPASARISLSGTPDGAVRFPFSIDVVENQLNRANFVGINPIVGGGTGASTATQAFINLAPSITGNGGKVLGTDGTNIAWVTPSGDSGGGENPLTFSNPLVRVGDTISMPVATASVNGYLSSSNFSYFSDKVGGATNLGSSGIGIFAQKVGTNLEFKRLLQGSNITLLEQAQGIVISAQAGVAGDDPWNALSILEFGGIPNDSSTSAQNANVTAWNNMIAAAADQQLCIIPDGNWYFNAQLIASTIIDPQNTSSLNNTRRFNIKIIGNSIFTNPASCGYILEGNYHKWDSSSGTITSTQTGSLSTFQGDGLYIKNCDKSMVDFNRITAFKNGLVVGGEGTGIVRGAQYNVVRGLQIRGCETNLLLTTRGTSTIAPPGGNNNGNWCNANIFYINQLGGGTNPTTGGTYGIRIQKAADSNQGDPFNGNFFFGTSIEGVVNGLYWEFAHFNSIIGMRFEGGAITNEIFFRTDASTGVECRRNLFVGSTIYEHYFVAGGRGIGTVINGPLLDTVNGNPIGDLNLTGFTSETFLGISGDETSGNLAGNHSSIAFGGYVNGASVWDHRYFARMKKIWNAGTFTRSVDFSDQSATNTAATYTSWPNDINILFNNYTAGIGSVTLPSSSLGLQLDRKIYIKNLSTTALNVNGLAAGETNTQIPAKGSLMVICNGSGWYVTSGSASSSSGVSSIESSSLENQLTAFTSVGAGQQIKKLTGTGYVKTSSGVPSFIASIPVSDLATTGTPASNTFLNGLRAWVTIGSGGSYIFSSGISESGGVVTNNLTTGIAGNQIVTGSISSGADLILRSTTHSTKGVIQSQDTILLRANTQSQNTAPIKWSRPSSTLPNLMSQQEDGAWEWDGVDWWATNLVHGRQKIITAATNAVLTNVTYNGAPITYNYGGRDSWEDGIPTISAGTGAGSSPTITFPSSNRNGWGKITVVAGSSPASSAHIVTVNFSASMANAIIVFSPGNSQAAARASSTWIENNGNTGFLIHAGSSALTAGTTYIWHYHVKRTQVVT